MPRSTARSLSTFDIIIDHNNNIFNHNLTQPWTLNANDEPLLAIKRRTPRQCIRICTHQQWWQYHCQLSQKHQPPNVEWRYMVRGWHCCDTRAQIQNQGGDEGTVCGTPTKVFGVREGEWGWVLCSLWIREYRYVVALLVLKYYSMFSLLPILIVYPSHNCMWPMFMYCSSPWSYSNTNTGWPIRRWICHLPWRVYLWGGSLGSPWQCWRCIESSSRGEIYSFQCASLSLVVIWAQCNNLDLNQPLVQQRTPRVFVKHQNRIYVLYYYLVCGHCGANGSRPGSRVGKIEGTPCWLWTYVLSLGWRVF